MSRQSSKSVIAHPAFPLVVAMWFAALLGLGSLVLPVALLERVVTASGLSAAIPAAAPPLGVSARAVLALATSLMGAGLGLFLAWQVRRSGAREAGLHSRIRPIDGLAPAHRRGPINARQDLGEGGLDELDEPIPGRRRPLAISAEEGPSLYLEPGSLPASFDPHAPAGLAEAAPAAPDQEEVIDDPAPDPELAAEPEVLELSAALADPQGAARWCDPAADASCDPASSPLAPPPAAADPSLAGGFVPPSAPPLAGPEPVAPPAPRFVDPRPFAPPAAAMAEAGVQGEAPAPSPPASAVGNRQGDATPVQAHEPVEPELAELVQHLGAVLAQWRAMKARLAIGSAPARSQPFTAPAAPDVAERVEVEQARRAWFAAPASVPAPQPDRPPLAAPEPAAPAAAALQNSGSSPKALRIEATDQAPPPALDPLAPMASDPETDPELARLAASFALPLGRKAAAGHEPPRQGDDAASGADDAPGSPAMESLALPAGLVRSPRPSFVRIEEQDAELAEPEPTVRFAQQPPAAPAGPRRFDHPDASTAAASAPRRERSAPGVDQEALREALLNLQRLGRSA